MDGLLEPLMYLVLTFCFLSIWHLQKRRLWWDAPMIVILLALAGCAFTSIQQGEAGILLAAGTLIAGFVLAEIPGRIGKRILLARIQGDTASALRWCRVYFLLQPTAYKRALYALLKLMRKVEKGQLDDKDAQRQLQEWGPFVDRLNNMSMGLFLWEALFSFVAHKGEWARLVRNFDPNLLSLYSHPPSGAGYWMVRALCEEEEWDKAAYILQAMEDASQRHQMVPEECDAFHNKARLIYLAYRGDKETVLPLLRSPSPQRLLFTKQDRKMLETLATTATPPALEPIEFIAPNWPTATKESDVQEEYSQEHEEPVERELEVPFFATNIDQQALSGRIHDSLQTEQYLSNDLSLWGNATPVTRFLITVNVLVFLWATLPIEWVGIGSTLLTLVEKTANPLLLLQHGGGHPGMFTVGEPWRLLSATFLHAGLIHLAFNSYFLLFFGPTIERLVGPWRFFNVYMFSGLGGFLLAFATGTDKVIVGASASIFGVFGATMAAVWLMRKSLPYRWYQRQLIICVVLLVLNTYLGVAIKAISFAAHTGGLLVGGALTALFLHPRLHASTSWKRMEVALTLALWLPLCSWTGWATYTASQQPTQQRLAKLKTMDKKAIPLFVSFMAFAVRDKKSVPIQRQVLTMTEDMGTAAVPLWLYGLHSPSNEIIHKVNVYFKRLGQSALPQILRSLKHENPDVRLASAHILKERTWPSAAVVPTLYKHRNESDSVVQSFILLALQKHNFAGLSKLQAKDILDKVISKLDNSNYWVRKNSVAILAGMSARSNQAFQMLKSLFLRTYRNSTAYTAGELLMKLGPKGLGEVTKATKHSHPIVRQRAQLILRTYVPIAPSQR